MFTHTNLHMSAFAKFERVLGEVAAATALFTAGYVLLMVA